MLHVDKLPAQKVPLPDRWMPVSSSWGWLWRTKEFVLGRAKTVAIDMTMIDFTALTESGLSNLAPGQPGFVDTSGLRVWQLDAIAIETLRRRLGQMPGNAILAGPRITTADGIEAELSMGGSTVDVSPRVIRGSVDLSTIITLSEAVTNQPVEGSGLPATSTAFMRTNFAVAARMQITNGDGVFLLDAAQSVAQRKRVGVIITVNLPASKN